VGRINSLGGSAFMMEFGGEYTSSSDGGDVGLGGIAAYIARHVG